jgi:site-specific recombinase XerD
MNPLKSLSSDFRLVFQRAGHASDSPYRLLDSQDREVDWVNEFLDLQHIRGLSPHSLRAYGYDLLHFTRWWMQAAPRPLSELNESNLLDYVRYQLDQNSKPAPPTINHRLTVLRCLYRFHYQQEIPSNHRSLQHTYTTHNPLGYGRRRTAIAGFRLKQPRRVIVPLSTEEVAQFWRGFRTFRDLSLIALMLLDGLRSCEIRQLQLENLRLSEAQIRVHGKGNKERMLPLPADTIQALQNYLYLERPLTNSPYLFVSLKGRQRGRPMTPAGIRSLFRHHRRQSQVPRANPHRFRHTFGSDMVRAGVSLPALMRLMGHAHIHTTMLYIEISPQDVWREYSRALQNRSQLSPQLPAREKERP